MSDAIDVLRDLFGRAHDGVPEVVDGLSPDDLLWRPDAAANPIAWLVWHLSRVQDDHLAEVAGEHAEQVWTAQGWAERFGLPYAVDATGFGQGAEEVGAFVLEDPGLLTGYHAAVHAFTASVLDGLDEAALDRVVDRRWDPPVTLGVRLVSVADDAARHLGQAAYVRGLLERRR